MDLLNFDKLAASLDVAAIGSVILTTWVIRTVFPGIKPRFVVLIPFFLGLVAYFLIVGFSFENPVNLLKYPAISAYLFKLTKDLLKPEERPHNVGDSNAGTEGGTGDKG